MIQLVGPGGAGKSTVGPVLAGRLACPFVDLDRQLECRHGDIDAFIAAHGYEAYARENVEVYLDVVRGRSDAVLALSSGFMVYPAAVHPGYATVRASIVTDPATFVLLPSFEREACVSEIVRRQLGRAFARRNAAREEAVIRERFERYLALPPAKVETMRPAHAVAEAILALLP